MKKIITLFALLFAGISFADQPRPWQVWLQDPATPVMERFYDLHTFVMWIGFFITIGVFSLMGYICYRFSAKSNPIPAKFSHNVKLEIIWTLIPVMVLVVMLIPGLRNLYFAEKIEKSDFTIKVEGYQWYWRYSYPDHGNIAFDSYMIPEKDLKPGQLRLLDVDNRLIVPVGKTIRFVITGADVIHSFAVPSFGVKTDAVPGRINETWVRVNKPGVYYGQCSELCGVNHGFMPIAIEAVPEEEFNEWLEIAKKKFI